MTLTEFLLDRIAEDKAEARAVLGDYAEHRADWESPSSGVVDIGDPGIEGLQPLGDGPLAHHIARWDPARVLAECEAKRHIMHAHRRLAAADRPDLIYPEAADSCISCGYGDNWQSREYGNDWPCYTLKALALPYADHPQFRPEWRP